MTSSRLACVARRRHRMPMGVAASARSEYTTVSGRTGAVWVYRDAMRDERHKLEHRRDELRARVASVEREFRRLTARVEAHYGELPTWWGDLD